MNDIGIPIPAGQRPFGWPLPDGSRLINPTQRAPHQLQLRDWVEVDGQAFQITDMWAVRFTGRTLALDGHTPVYLRAGETMTAFKVIPPSAKRLPRVPGHHPVARAFQTPTGRTGAGAGAPGRW